jgi:membrane associated rhomboid family serine protease
MIFPVAHEHMGHRRWPIITIVIVAVCFLVHVVVTPIEKQRGEEANRALKDAFSYHAHHPYLQLEQPLNDMIGYVRGSRPRVDKPDPQPDNEDELRREQAYLDNLSVAWRQRLDDLPRRKFGYVPARGDVLQIITHQFLHGDWIHLLSNMWFLWLCGVNLEDRWGRLIYGPFFLASGIAAALVELFFGGIPDVPRIGASGAIAGAMGAFFFV